MHASEAKKDVTKDEDDWSDFTEQSPCENPKPFNLADFEYSQNQYERDLDEQVAKILDEAGIPCVLFAKELLDIYGVPTGTWGSTWVIADDLIEKAYEALRDAEIPPCVKGADCDEVRPNRSSPIPAYHFHPDNDFDRHCHTLEPPAPDDPNYMLVTDTRLPKWRLGTGAGRYRLGAHPIKIPTPARYAEEMFYLVCRDMKGLGHRGYWEVQLTYMLSLLEDPKSDVFRISDVAQPARGYLELYVSETASFKDMRRYAKRVRTKLIERNELPPPPGCGESEQESWDEE